MSMEECIKHFSHEHPLSFFQLDADEDPKPHRCRICALPILSTPSYTCRVDPNCNHFFVHKACTQLPEYFYHRLHLENLYLRKPARVGDSFKYEGECTSGLDLHPLVEQPVEIKSRHKSHIAHPLVVFCREVVCRCDVCGKQEKGFFFYCIECGFFVHQDCTVLPSVMKLPSHPHPFILAYSLPYRPQDTYSRKHLKCSICSKEWRLPDGGVYFCGDCYSVAHVHCAKPCMENAADTEIVHLPDDEEDTFPSLAIRKFVERNSSSSCIGNIIKVDNKMMMKSHKHPLILEDACSSDSVVCDICIQPINVSSQLFRCHDCQFLAHRICADLLPPHFELFSGPNRLNVWGVEERESYFNSVFLCDICSRPSNGFSYKITKSMRYFLSDVECTVAPKTIKHAAHKQHILFQTNTRLWIWETDCKLTCCSEKNIIDIYRCCVCDYSIHIRCALLPKTTRFKFDDHPLHLITSHDDEEKQGRFCEVCEQEMELKWWYYGCNECEHYFHINCIPSVGYHSKVKFGKTRDVDNKLHQHPLTLTRMLTHQRNESCGKCNRIIKGFSDDEMALHCSHCDFWIHFSCAAATTNKLDYSGFNEDEFFFSC